MNIGKLLVELSEKSQKIEGEREKESFITNSILNYLTDNNIVNNDTPILIKVK